MLSVCVQGTTRRRKYSRGEAEERGVLPLLVGTQLEEDGVSVGRPLFRNYECHVYYKL